MGAIDPARRIVRLTRAELAAATALAGAGRPGAGPDQPADLEELVRAGIVVGGSLHPAVAQVVAVVSGAQLLLTLETWAAGTVVVHRAWATPELAVVGRSVAADVVEYTATDLVSVPFFLAALVGLGRRPVSGPSGPLRASPAALDAAGALVDEGDTGRAREALVADGVPTDQAATLVDVLARRRVSWRAVSTWAGPAGEVGSRSVTVVDAAESGLWLCRPGGPEGGSDAGAEPPLVLTPMAPSQAWQELT
ncbi:MAG TPA: hypothetical protein VHE80_06700, partial [Acidimicrobiales bacterium]|nr:hypothetical protein [Acidimicrobiales bacterium]